jgi:hypothetical protein
MESVSQLALPLFEPPGFDDLLKQRNATHHLSVAVNRRLKRSWQVKFLPLVGKRRLIIPPYLNDSPEEIKNALIDWALLPYPRRRAQKRIARQQRSLLEKIIRRHIESLPSAPHRTTRFDAAAFEGKTKGLRYDLQEIFDVVNSACFNGTLKAVVRWGREGSKTSYHTKKNDKQGNRVDLITIAGVYNHPEAPQFAIEAIMYHEMLHIAIPPFKRSGRNVVHGKEFSAAEKKFHHYKEWREWERECLMKIVRETRRRRWRLR